MSRLPICAAMILTLLGPASTAPAQSPHIVNVACCAFQDPANGNSNQTIIPVGTSVKWMRTDALPHTATSGSGPTDPNAGAVFNGSLAGATTNFTFAFNSLGTFPYFCSFHAAFGMTGTVFVLPVAAATSVGTGCSSSVGVASLVTNGLPKVGNATFGFTLSGGPAGAPGYLFLAGGIAPSPLLVTPTCLAYLDLVSLVAFIQAGLTPTGPQALSAGGTTVFPIPIPNNPAFGGITAAGQGLIIDGAAPGGIALSNAITLVVGA